MSSVTKRESLAQGSVETHLCGCLVSANKGCAWCGPARRAQAEYKREIEARDAAINASPLVWPLK